MFSWRSYSFHQHSKRKLCFISKQKFIVVNNVVILNCVMRVCAVHELFTHVGVYIVTFFSVTIDGVLDWGLELLTIYSYYS
jgi:hypothetical protein